MSDIKFVREFERGEDRQSAATNISSRAHVSKTKIRGGGGGGGVPGRSSDGTVTIIRACVLSTRVPKRPRDNARNERQAPPPSNFLSS